MLGGCSSFSLVEAGRVNIGALYSVEPQRSWSRVVENGIELWTIDGPLLEAVRFIRDIDDGYPLVYTLHERDLPEFQANMTPSDVQELVVDTLAAFGAGRVEADGLRPGGFGSRPGFRFELTFVEESGLEVSGLVAGMIHDERLHLIVYTGARTHYFDQHRERVERLIESVGPPL